MKYENIKEGIFLSRPNRFIAEVLVDGKTERVHVRNTGRLGELMISGSRCILEEGNNPSRKTRYSLTSIEKGGQLVNIDSQIPNAVAAEALEDGHISEIGIPQYIKREVKYGSSRFDIYYEKDGRKGFVEVKGVTLDVNSTAMFPDAPTERGTKHIHELVSAKSEGYDCSVLFVIQMKGITAFAPNAERDKAFADALKTAYNAGVNILAYDCVVTEDSITLDKPIEIKL